MNFRVLIALTLLFFSARAEEDLFSILEAEPTTAIIEEQSELVQVLKETIGPLSAEQNIFFNFISKNDYERALFQWSAAFEETNFARQPTGQAFFAYVLWKNGLVVTAIEKLFAIKEVDKIPEAVKQIWRLEAPSDHKVWKAARVEWQPLWNTFFDINTEVAVLSRKEFDLNKKQEIYELLKKTQLKTTARYWLEWQMALSLAMNNEIVPAAKVLSHLSKEKQNVVSKELINITAARWLYERGYLDASINYYNKIPKSSEYWFEAQEELAWTYMRKGQPQDALAIAKTQMIAEFAPHTGPEMIFLKALAQLKLCDFNESAQTLMIFKQRFYQRARDLMEVRDLGITTDTEKLVMALKKGRVELLNLGASAAKIPRYVSRDEYLMDLTRTWHELEKETLKAEELYARSLTGGTSEVGFQAFLAQFKRQVEKRELAAKNATYSLIQRRAKEELEEIHQILQKMHIIEAELIQQTAMSDRVLASQTKYFPAIQKGTIKTPKKYDLVFPFDGEKWFDELSNYRIDVNKACGGKRASVQ